VSLQGTKIILGYFLAELDAAGVYSLAAKKFNGQFAGLNIRAEEK
jgi:hypothetical protein